MCRSEIRNAFDIHAACQDRNCSVSTIKKLLDKAGPEVLAEKDVYGRVPLFYAIRRRCSLPVIHMLFDNYPKAILEADFCGDLPLYMLFGAQIDYHVLQYVLEKDPLLALFSEKRFSGSQTLLQTICAQWVMEIRNRKVDKNNNTHNNPKQQTVFSRNTLFSDSELLNRWTKLVLMVRAAHCVMSHTTASTIDTTDSSNTTTIIPKMTDDDDDNDDDDIPELHLALELGSILPRTVIAQFIEVYPEQAAKPVLGKRKDDERLSSSSPRKQQHRSLPLHLAISTQRLSWNDGLKALVYAHPSALFQEDVQKLVPFLQQATAANNKNDKESYDTVYCLLREDPSVLSRILSTR